MKAQNKALIALAGALGTALMLVVPAQAHHSFAMYNLRSTKVFTGVVTRVDPAPNHLQIFFAPMNDERTNVMRDENDEPIVWSVEMAGSAAMARQGVSVNSFPRGTVFSVALHPLRNGPGRPARGGIVPAPRAHAAVARHALRLGHRVRADRRGAAAGADRVEGYWGPRLRRLVLRTRKQEGRGDEPRPSFVQGWGAPAPLSDQLWFHSSRSAPGCSGS
jgi:hypothetical protein